MNNTYKIKFKTPLLRPGMEIETEVSEKYVIDAVKKSLEMIRAINN